jgi:hypothetical protein
MLGVPMDVDTCEHVSGNLAMTENEALGSYRNIAAALKEDNCVSKVCILLDNITSGDIPETGFDDLPFTFLEGSSGSGKSQMGFSIYAQISKIRKVFYFLFEPPGSSSQEIYRNFRNISTLFKKCYSKDSTFYGEEASSPNCNSLFGVSLYVYGFIYELISGGNGNVNVGPKTGKVVVDLMVTNGIHFKRPVFIVDECIAISDESLRKVRFVRNCFRSLGLGLVMCGTDSRAAKLPSNIGNSSRSGISKPWCYVFGHFPNVNLPLLDLPEWTPEWLKIVLQHSRPLFAKFVADEIRNTCFDNFNVDKLLMAVFNKLVNVKKIFGTYYGQLGQLRLFHNSHYNLKDFNEQSTALIHSHYAQLSGPKNFVLMNDGSFEGCDTIWMPCSIFPKIEDDVLLYLILMGGNDYPAFRLNGNPVSYAYFLLNIKNDIDYRSHILDFSNAVQTSNDGMFLESLLCSTVCLSSHSNGVQGIELKSFLINLVFQLQIDKLNPTEVSISGLEKLDNLSTLIIPFLSPPNQAWPNFLDQVPSSNFGLLERTKNSDMIDLWVSVGIAGESKDYGSEIDLNTMRQILKRVRKDVKLELVFTRKLQNSYFNHPASFESDFEAGHQLKMAYFKIDATKPETSLMEIKGLPNDYSSGCGIVIFLEINSRICL